MDTETGKMLTLLKLEHLHRLLLMHVRHGLTLTELRSLFESARNVPQVNDWIEAKDRALVEQGEIPLRPLLLELEKQKSDLNATPNINVARERLLELKKFSPDRLLARLRVVADMVGTRWIEVVEDRRDVLMHQVAEQVSARLEAELNMLGGIANAQSPGEES